MYLPLGALKAVHLDVPAFMYIAIAVPKRFHTPALRHIWRAQTLVDVRPEDLNWHGSRAQRFTPGCACPTGTSPPGCSIPQSHMAMGFQESNQLNMVVNNGCNE